MLPPSLSVSSPEGSAPQERERRGRPSGSGSGAPPSGRVRVLTVDDSPLVRLALERHLQDDPDIQVVGHACHGLEMLQRVRELNPDVVVLDVEMPEMDGLTALQRLMATAPRPVIMLSYLTAPGSAATLSALELGALDFVTKPGPGITLADTVRTLAAKIREYARVAVRPPQGILADPAAPPVEAETEPRSPIETLPPLAKTDFLVVVASSTGGPSALAAFLRALPPGLPIGGLVIQHIPERFARILATRLDRLGLYRVAEAQPDVPVRRGVFLVAPTGTHLVLTEDYRVQLVHGPFVHNMRPAADVTLHNVAQHHGSRVIAVVLSGMGRDGLEGARWVRACGGTVLVQNEATSVVYGMPRYVRQAGLADFEGSPEALAGFLARKVDPS